MQPPEPESSETVNLPKTEFDLDSPDDVLAYLKLFFSEKSAAENEATLAFAVQSFKAKSTKTEPLSNIVQKEIVIPKILMKKEGRAKFLASWKSKRSQRFAPLPDFAKGK